MTITRQCAHCQTTIRVPPNAPGKRFCSSKCRYAWANHHGGHGPQPGEWIIAHNGVIGVIHSINSKTALVHTANPAAPLVEFDRTAITWATNDQITAARKPAKPQKEAAST